MFALLVSLPRFNGINVYQNRPKIKLFLPKKNAKCLSAGGSAPKPPTPGLRPQTSPLYKFPATRLGYHIVLFFK